jgi:hypothetical protein
MARSSCLYCGAVLPAELVAEVAAASAPATPALPGEAAAASEERPPSNRMLVVLDLAGADVPALSRALALSAFEAGQRAIRGGYHLHRILSPDDARLEAERIAGEGLRIVLVPETEARQPPAVAVGGKRDGEALALRSADGALRIEAGEVLLVVRGPIVREYQAAESRRKVQTATLEGGYRIHLHRREAKATVELDPAGFEFDERSSPGGSSMLELSAWVEAARGKAPVDDAFRALPPALGPSAPEPTGRLHPSSLGGRSALGSSEGPVILDNLEQFRFYSGWRAAVERRR